MNNVISIVIGICFLGILFSISYCDKKSNELEEIRMEKNIPAIEMSCANLAINNAAQMAVCIEYYKNKETPK
jgi:hypothetical protein